MTIRGHSQGPGPLGLSRAGDGISGPAGAFRDGGRVPEPAEAWWEDGGWAPQPIGTLWDRQSNPPASGPATKSVKTTIMPAPTNDQSSKDVHVVLLPLFDPKKKVPSFTEVKQAPEIANCPVAAMLAALASTPDGQKLIHSMLTETPGNVVTDLSAIKAGILSNPPGATLSSNRYFTVKLPGAVRVQLSGDNKLPGAVRVSGKPDTFVLPGGSIDVSDVLYTDDHDSGWSPLYLRDPGDQTIWASVIEKALAVRLGSYEDFDALNISANDFWNMITGAQPAVIEIKPDTPLSAITSAVNASARTPSIAASRGEPGNDIPLKGGKFLTAYHGFALLGFQGDNIRLYDPAEAKTLLLSPAEFRADFKDILYRQ